MRLLRLALRLVSLAGLLASPLVATIDRNGDGVSDIWTGLHPAAGAPELDPDGDGAANRAEALAGTDPTSATSHLAATPERDPDGDLRLGWPSVVGKQYQIESTADLSTWIPFSGTLAGTGANLSVIVSAAGTAAPIREFWRVTVSDADTDSDGLNDWEEALYGTSPIVADTDADSRSDLWEIHYGRDPRVTDPAGDDPGPPPSPIAPIIAAHPLNVTVTAGQTATFSVAASGTPTPIYRWFKDGTLIGGAVSASYTTPTTIAADNGAVFTVVVTNSEGSVLFNDATLTTCGLPDPTSYVPGTGGTLYEIGPGKTYTSTHQIPLHLLKAGDVVRIYAKPNRAPYLEKLYIAGVGTSDNPIVVVGIPDAQGNKPIFSGANATGNPNYLVNGYSYYWNENREVIMLGQSGDHTNAQGVHYGPARYFIVDNLEITGAIATTPFRNTQGHTNCTYDWNAAGVWVQDGRNITLRRCDIHHNENGIFSDTCGEITVEYSYIHDNGVMGSDQHHNFYMNGGAGSVFTLQFTHVGEELNDGQQVKSRAETTIIRYNWIEGGRNSLMDLVEDVKNGVSDAYVYGNILYKVPPTHNKRIIHFGGDNSSVARTGTLYFFNNTLVNLHNAPNWQPNNTVYLFQINESGAKVVADNNIIYSVYSNGTVNSSRIIMCMPNSAGTFDPYDNLTGSNNWISSNTQQTHSLTNSILGLDPGFVDFANGNLFLATTSTARDVSIPYTPPGGFSLTQRYYKHAGCEPRSDDGELDRGALE